MAKVICDHCLEDGPEECECCGVRNFTFWGSDCIKTFNDYVLSDLAQLALNQKGTVLVFAHNFKGYDGHFVLRDLWARSFEKFDIIMQGRKVLKIEEGNVKYIDSLSFFQLPLASLPKSFGFENLVEKGYFPHYFNTTDNQDYVGIIPQKKDFGYEDFMPAAKAKFDEWYDSWTGDWDFKEEIEKYCRNDVEILSMAVMKFRKEFMVSCLI